MLHDMTWIYAVELIFTIHLCEAPSVHNVKKNWNQMLTSHTQYTSHLIGNIFEEPGRCTCCNLERIRVMVQAAVTACY